MGEPPTLEEILLSIIGQWDDGGKQIAVNMLTKGDYRELEDAVKTIERIYKKYSRSR